jgi:hypothetical protein
MLRLTIARAFAITISVAGMALVQAGCATTAEEAVSETTEATQAPPPSFLNSCRGTNSQSMGYERNSSGLIVRAWAPGGCRRFDGSWGGPVLWAGSCAGDVSNCNGNIGCPPRC